MAMLNDTLKHNRISTEKIDYTKAANSSQNIGYLDGKKIKRVIIYLRGRGCEWSCKKNGGCLMCGHYYGTARGDEVQKEMFYEQFLKEYSKYDFSEIPMLCIYNAGSILNPNEVPAEELLHMLAAVAKNPDIKRVILETRPEYINLDILKAISSICKDKIVEIGIGLETSNDYIRELCINKGFSFLEYMEAVCKIKKYSNLRTLTYLTVKPLFLTINESINDVCSSINDIASYTDIISLESISIQKNTVVEYLYTMGLYIPPKGWMIKEILPQINDCLITNECDLRIGGFEYYPIPDLVINNCKKCNGSLYKAIDEYNSRKNKDLLESLECKCYDIYLNDKNTEDGSVSVEDRASEIIRKVLYKVVS